MLRFFLVDSLPHILNVLRSKLFSGQKSGSSYKSFTLLHFFYNQTASDASRYNNPVCKLMTDKLQLMLINVLLGQFLNTKVSQGR